MLYKTDTRPSVAARAPKKTANQRIERVAKALGNGSTDRAMLQFAQEHPKEFWTQLYAKLIDRTVTVGGTVAHLHLEALKAASQQAIATVSDQPIEDATLYIEGADASE